MVCSCGALVEQLIQSELFGHLKGSYTGAVNDKIGLIEAAGEGDLLLDEIGGLPLFAKYGPGTFRDFWTRGTWVLDNGGPFN